MGEAGVKTAPAALVGLSVLVVLALASCASPKYDVEPGPAHPPAQRPTYHPPTVETPTRPSAPPDQCGAHELQWLVGKPKSDIPIPAEITNRRVMCTTCPRTEEYISRRLNIEFDQNSGIVQSVRCG